MNALDGEESTGGLFRRSGSRTRVQPCSRFDDGGGADLAVAAEHDDVAVPGAAGGGRDTHGGTASEPASVVDDARAHPGAGGDEDVRSQHAVLDDRALLDAPTGTLQARASNGE